MPGELPFKEPGRKNPSSGVHIQSGAATIVLLNITTENRIPWLACKEAHNLLHQTWSESQAWLIGDYILMPDHLHALCAPRQLEMLIEDWIKYWKREFRMKHKNPGWKFQSRGWHHRLRDGESHSEAWKYMQENPLRKGLVKRIEDWPYKGRLFELRWNG